MTKGLKAHGTFRDLARLLDEAGIHPGPPAQKPFATAPAEPRKEEASDEVLFSQAMEDVTRASWKHNPPASPPSPPLAVLHDSDSEDRRLMEAAVEGTPAMEVPDHPEYIEGWIGVAGRRFLPNLRNGLYSIQGQIDLHGLSREEARRRVEEFIVQGSRFRSCCVKIIHGRGINSPNDTAVLKESLQRWLSTRRMSRHVVAYASAPLKDGGVGAVYVLLRRS
jgi:DNA-nicking Smr family endonuclease